MLLAAVTLAAVGSAWWKHRSVCLEKVQFHAERNDACAKTMFGKSESDGIIKDGWFDLGPSFLTAAIINGEEGSCSYHMQKSRTRSGYDLWVLTVEYGKLPDAENRIQAELDRESDLADQYLHAIWRPWEIFWIDETP